jgi:hypothetical protein
VRSFERGTHEGRSLAAAVEGEIHAVLAGVDGAVGARRAMDVDGDRDPGGDPLEADHRNA